MQHKQLEIIQDDCITIVKRKDFFDTLKPQLESVFDLTGAKYFAHQLIENYYLPDHFVSSFNTCEDWSDIYWKEYWYQDSIERKVHKNARLRGASVVLWNIADTQSKCMQQRKLISKTQDGVIFSYQHPSGTLENFTLAWENLDLHTFDVNKVEKLEELLNPIRSHHRQVYRNL
jgi:hypothetical protein